MHVRPLLSVLLCCLPLLVAAETSFEEVAATLAAPDVLRGNFAQSRKIALLEKPLHSSGRFLLSGKGLYWQQDEPLAAIMIADGEQLRQQVNGGAMQTIDAAQNPMIMTFSTSFLSIFSGNEAELKDNFDVIFAATANGWTMELTPNGYPLSEAIYSIVLHGREYIETLKVTSRSLDETEIRFTDLQTQPEQLTDHEIELYAR